MSEMGLDTGFGDRLVLPIEPPAGDGWAGLVLEIGKTRAGSKSSSHVEVVTWLDHVDLI